MSSGESWPRSSSAKGCLSGSTPICSQWSARALSRIAWKDGADIWYKVSGMYKLGLIVGDYAGAK